MDHSEKRIILGKLSAVYGVKGWIKVTSSTQPRENIFNYPEWQLKVGNQWKTIQIEQGRPHGKTLVVKLTDCNDRDQAKLLVGAQIAVYREQLPEITEGEFYWADLLGMEVLTVAGEVLGKVKEIMETGANDVLVVSNKVSGKTVECLVPWLDDDVIIDVKKKKRQIIVDWDPDF
ncbi:MAG: ribosome maturation factor RimM [Gammaproteobacteria bacterium]|nr:MAG: ribosome maturation factor RimM [Gammaproteobacteria bacterium]